MHLIWLAWPLARAKAGKRRPARMAMIAMTTNSSMRVKPTRCQRSNKAFRFEVVITAQLVEFGFVQKLNVQIRTSIKDYPKNNRNQPAENCAFDRTPKLARDEGAPSRNSELSR